MKFQENKKNQFVALGTTAAIMVGLLFGSTYMYVDNKSLRETNRQTKEQLDSMSGLKASLENDLKTIDMELNRSKGKNKELDEFIASQNAELELRKVRIEKLVKENASLAKLKKEVEELKAFRTKNLAQVRALEAEIETLSKENAFLKNDNLKLRETLLALEGQNLLLGRKVEIASALRVENVLAGAFRQSKSGKLSKSENSKKMDRIVITFDMLENKIAEHGEKNIYVRILDPKGKTLPAPATEAGNFSNLDNNVTLPYSMMKALDYKGTKQRMNMVYEMKGVEFEKGTYNVEFYCDGYYCGSSKIRLKK